ncbi:hypothetical protein FKP32DRAFT_1671465 [Trametes sanguinea]|nr:hypothetical protein FKP32DRAFT_1671465 [Trametes sanguinea]
MQAPRLPPDLCFAIIDAVWASADWRDTDRLATLRACALTSTTWWRRARYQLYRRVALADPSETLCRFVRTITESPALGDLVKWLDLVVAHQLDDDADDPYEDRYWQEYEMADEEVHGAAGGTTYPFHSILHCLTSLERLCLQSKDSAEELTWSYLFRFASITSLKHLAIHCFPFLSIKHLIQVLQNMPPLQSLSLRGLSWYDDDNRSPLEHGPTFGNKLESLDLFLNMDDRPLIRLMPDTVQTLMLHPNMEHYGNAQPYVAHEGLNRYRSLTKMSLMVRLDEATDWVPEALSRVRSSPLQEVELRFWTLHSLFTTSRILERVQAEKIHQVLSRDGSFSQLRTLRIKVDPAIVKPPESEDLVGAAHVLVNSIRACFASVSRGSGYRVVVLVKVMKKR